MDMQHFYFSVTYIHNGLRPRAINYKTVNIYQNLASFHIYFKEKV